MACRLRLTGCNGVVSVVGSLLLTIEVTYPKGKERTKADGEEATQIRVREKGP
ncbi:hypothetical protein HanPSC8_Chr10g0443821 [Helianthus annuus]|nr:hypothetical protein HanPSC8_Chr10g0443821 [Helianthus annuus]